MSQQQLDRLIQLSQAPPRHGKWAEFCLQEGLTKDTVYHWRKKLRLSVRCTQDSVKDKRAERLDPPPKESPCTGHS